MPRALSSHLSCLPAPGHVLREALACLGGPGSASTQASETPPPWGDGPIPGQFLSPDRIREERQEVPHRHVDVASHPSGWGLEKGWGGPEVTHGKASQSQEPDPGIPTALFPGSFTADRSVSPPVTPKEIDGGKGRKGRKKSRLVFKRPVLKKSTCLYRLPAPPLSRRLAPGTTPISLLHCLRGCRCHLSEPVRGRLAKKSDAENSTAVLKKLNIEFHSWLPKELKAGTHTHVHSSITHNSPMAEATRVSTNG